MISSHNYKAVIFDMNGVIVLDEQLHEHAFREVLADNGVELTHKNYQRIFSGRTDYEGLLEAKKEYDLDYDVNQVLKLKSIKYHELFIPEKYINPETVDLISKLNGKFSLALTSSSNKSEVDTVIDNANIRKYLDVIITADDVIQGKPDPEPYIKTSDLLKVKPQDCAVIEDSKSGILSANSAGMFSIGITTTHDKESLQDASIVVDSFSEIEMLFI